MASIRKRGGKYHVQVRRKGHPPATRSFTKKADAERWARQVETEAERTGLQQDRSSLKGLTVGDLLVRYRDQIVPKKRPTTAKVETDMINALLRYSLAEVALDQLSAAPFVDHRDRRLATIKPASLRRELGLVQHAFEVARKEWGLPIETNPVAAITMPRVSNRRDRRLERDELERLLSACRGCRNKNIEPLIRVAIETGMRRSELVNIREADLNRATRTLHVPQTKNGHARTIPLSREALRVLEGQQGAADGRLFPMTANAVRLAWEDLKRRAEVEDLRFHDLRHEAVSRFFERGLNVPEVALISGHRDYRMLYRYTHLKPESLVDRLG